MRRSTSKLRPAAASVSFRARWARHRGNSASRTVVPRARAARTRPFGAKLSRTRDCPPLRSAFLRRAASKQRRKGQYPALRAEARSRLWVRAPRLLRAGRPGRAARSMITRVPGWKPGRFEGWAGSAEPPMFQRPICSSSTAALTSPPGRGGRPGGYTASAWNSGAAVGAA
jgi:hypothetical protein